MEHTVIGILEYNSIAIGIEGMDAMAKAAPITIIDARTICPGKYYIVITGDVASVDAALTAGKENRLGALVDELFIPNLDKQIIPAITGAAPVDKWDAVGVIESFSVASSVACGDLAVKEARVIIPEIRLAVGMGGKSYVKIMGTVEEVQAAVEAGVSYVRKSGLLCSYVVIPRPHPDIKPFFL